MVKKQRIRQNKLQRSQPQPVDVLRMATVIQEGINREDRSIPLILATESPVRVYDLERMEVVDEVLSLDGMDIPNQVPMADSHKRDSVRNTFGSFREFEVTNGELRCRAYFASDQESVNVFNKYADGHLTDFSVGAQSLQRKYDKKTKTITRSVLIEGSAVLKGADVNAKALVAQRAYAEPEELRKETMDKELMKLLVERGLDAEANDKQILEFLERELSKDAPGIDTKTALDVVRSLKDKPEPAKEVKQASTEELGEIQRSFKERWNSIDDLCRSHNVDDKTRREYLDGGKDVNEIATDILNRTYKPSGVAVGPGQTLERGASERDKFYNAVEYSMVQRSLNGVAVSEELQREIGDAPIGAGDFRYMRVPEIARQFCERAGMDVSGLPSQEIIRRAISQQSFVERSGGSFHTTGSFANIFLNSMHKTLRAAYNEAPSTFDKWVRTAEDATDFKNMDKIVFGEMSMPEEVPENGIYPDLTTSDGKESYRVAKNGGIFSITLEMLVNDDLGAMNRRVQMMGTAMRRKINRQAYELLLDNAALSDGVALFHATSHGANLDTTALAEGALDTGYLVMGTQAGLDTTTVLGLTPRYLIVPSALAATALRLVNGGYMPTTVATNPLYGAGRPRNLEVIEDGQLDNLGSATNWWLAADNNTIDTVEISYLQGERTPAISREDSFETDAIKSKIRQTYGIKAIDFRGLYQGNT